MRRKWLRIALWVLLTPIILFIILMILLYVPPVQNLIRKQATAIASGATGMDISVERIDLRFPLNLLVRGVLVVQPADSAVDVQFFFHGMRSSRFCGGALCAVPG